MSLPTSGLITMGMVNTALSNSSTASITLNDSAVRSLFNKSSGLITLDDGHYAAIGTQNNPASSVTALYNAGYRTDGVYYINLPTVGSKPCYCLLNSSVGGGWVMILKATRGNTFQYDSSYWTSVNTLNASDTTRNDGDAKFDAYNYYQGNEILALWPDIGTNGGSYGSTSYNCWNWYQNISNVGYSNYTFLSLMNNTSRTFIQDATTWSGWGSGIFSTQPDVHFYGFNYYNDPGWARTRWGFGWNENGGGLFPNGDMGSDDVYGGIGLKSSSWGNGSNGYSAGDVITCCQDSNGINRSARVEIYIR